MKSCIFAAALVATAQASAGHGYGGHGGYGSSIGHGSGYGSSIGHGGHGSGYGRSLGGYGGHGSKGHGGYTKVDYVPHTKVVQPAKETKKASQDYAQDYAQKKTTNWDAWGRDQDLAIDESYGNTKAKSYRAESYDEWDNKDDDQHGAQSWGKDKDAYGASSQEYDASASDYGAAQAAHGGKAYGSYGHGQHAGYGKQSVSKGHGYGHGKSAHGAHGSYGKAAHGSYGKSYAGEQNAAANKQGASWQAAQQKNAYDNDSWAKQAYGEDQDSRWGKSYDSVEARSYDNEHYAREVRADDDQWAEDRDSYGYGDYDQYGAAASASSKTGYSTDFKKASEGKSSMYSGDSRNQWDAYGRDQDFHEKTSFDNTRAKAYEAESYDEWDNNDADKWGAQAWGSDQDVYGASSYGAKASSGKYGDSYAKGHPGSGKGAQASKWAGASASDKASNGAYDNDAWSKQAYGEDTDSRWGKSYDSVKARSYENQEYARWLQADDDQWAEDYNNYDSGDVNAYGKAASVWSKEDGYGHGGYGHGSKGAIDAASKAGSASQYGKHGSDWDAWGRDQDLEVDESYKQTWAKSYDAESYDEWDNKDGDRWGAQGWGQDQDQTGASSYGSKASAGDYNSKYYADGKAYGNHGAKGYGSSHGKGYGSGYGGHGSSYGSHQGHSDAGMYGKAYNQAATQGQDYAASQQGAAAQSGYDNDAWAKNAYGQDTDSRWGKSYDFVNANEYDDEQYARKVRADDDQWAEDYDVWTAQDQRQYAKQASVERDQPRITKTTYTPHVSHGSYGYGQGW